MAKELISLQQKESALLKEKDRLEATQSVVFEQHAKDLEAKIKALLDNHHLDTADLHSRLDALSSDLTLHKAEADVLRAQLENKTIEQKNQILLANQIQDLAGQLRAKEEKIASMKREIHAGQQSQEVADTLKQQLAAEQDHADMLKRQLDNKVSESNKIAFLMEDYRKKLEFKDSAYNEQYGQLLVAKNYQVILEKQVTDLNARLQEKEAQIVNIKKDMYDLKLKVDAKDRDAQSKDLSASMVQQKMMDAKIREYQVRINGLQAVNVAQAKTVMGLREELALVRQKFGSMPSPDELEFLRAGLKKATLELKQKDDLFFKVKANADEYEKEFKEQTQEFVSLKEQLQNALGEIDHKNEDLKYKDMEMIRFKERSTVKENDLLAQIKALTRQSGAVKINPVENNQGDKIEALKAQLENANAQIKDLQSKRDLLKEPVGKDRLQEKLKQALDKIDQQGRMLNMLVDKLHELGQNVDLKQYISN